MMIVMKNVGWRGDFFFVFEFFVMVKECNIFFLFIMMICLVEVYCKNDCYSEVENFVIDIIKENKFEGDYVYMWNLFICFNVKC